jgi:hypothetical protein
MSVKSFACVLLLGFITPAVTFAQGKAVPPGKGADACTLVSKAEIEEAMGLKLQDGKKNPNMQNAGVLSSCDYSTQSGGQVSILIRQNPTKYVPGTEKAEFEKQGMKLTYLKGLGTTAALMDMMGMGSGLIVFRGDYDYVQVSAMMSGVDGKLLPPRLEKLTRLVLDRWK